MTDGRSPRIGIVTGDAAPALTDDGRALRTELRGRGLTAEPVIWTDSRVDWGAFDAVLVRSCWDYHTQPDTFREWVERIEHAGTVLLNAADGIRWNMHKFYLRDLAEEGVSILPTVWIERGSATALQAVLQTNDWEDAVVKPAIGTSSAGIWRTSLSEASTHQQRFDALISDEDVLVQEFASEIHDGERSFVFFEGRFSHATKHRPSSDDFRAHPTYGGTAEPYEPPRGIVEQAAAVLETACSVVGIAPSSLPYARVDGIEREGAFRLIELELIEPYLSLDAGEDAVTTFADAIESALDRRATSSLDSEHTLHHSAN